MNAESPRATVGLQYPFHESMPGRFADPDRASAFWRLVEGYRTASWSALPVRTAWPASVTGGVSAHPDLARHHAGEISLVASIAGLVESGCDAIAVCDMQDPGVELARSSFDVPVVGALEASLVVARAVGHRIGWVTAREYVSDAHLERNLARLGLAGRPLHAALPEWGYELLLQSAEGTNDRFLEDFDRCASQVVLAGADVVVPVCVFLGPALGLRHYREVGTSGVPVIDPFGAVITVASGLAELRRATGLRSSKGLASIYRGVDQGHRS
jgi:Asp/Glu/hydantoin racemase